MTTGGLALDGLNGIYVFSQMGIPYGCAVFQSRSDQSKISLLTELDRAPRYIAAQQTKHTATPTSHLLNMCRPLEVTAQTYSKIFGLRYAFEHHTTWLYILVCLHVPLEMERTVHLLGLNFIPQSSVHFSSSRRSACNTTVNDTNGPATQSDHLS